MDHLIILYSNYLLTEGFDILALLQHVTASHSNHDIVECFSLC